MTEFIYNKTKNTSSNHISFKLKFNYYHYVFFKDKTNQHSKFCSINKLSKKLKELILICLHNLFNTHKLQKQTYDKDVKLWCYILANKIWLKSKYIKIKPNQKLEIKFFSFFQVIYLVSKQSYKQKLSSKWKIYKVFYISLLKQENTRKGHENKNVESELKFKASKNNEYKVKIIQNSTVYANKPWNLLLGLY